MTPKHSFLGLFLLPALLVGAAGCADVAASAAGGALVVAGGHLTSDTAEDVAGLGIDRAELAAQQALKELDVDVVDTTRSREDDDLVRCHIEACLVGADVAYVDIDLKRLTNRMTNVRVTTRRSALKPELAVSEEILDRIIRQARAAGRAGSMP